MPHIGAVTVSAGIHIDNAKQEDIAVLSRNIEELMAKLIETVANFVLEY